MQVLIVGKSQKALDGAVALIRARGHHADATNVFGAVLTEFELSAYDVVVLGGMVPPDLKAEFASAFRAANADVVIVHGMAGIPGVLAAQVEEVASADAAATLVRPRFVAASGTGPRHVAVTLSRAERAEVTVFWGTSFIPPDPESTSLDLVAGELSAGEHAIALPDVVPDQPVFVSVRLAGVTFALSSAA